jgi:DNA-binding transcriptional ArsR family regulator
MRRTKEDIEYEVKTEDLAKFAKALGHPTRIAILNYLDNQNCCFTGDLVDVFPLAQSTISQHLKELKNAELVQGELKPPKIKYCINQEEWRKAKKLFNDFFEVDFRASSCDNC